VTLFRGDQELLRRSEAIQPRQLYRRVFALADAVARELGLTTPKARAPRGPRSFVALRDYLRATDLDDGRQALAREDQRLAVEWLLLSVEADPQFEPARDALLTTVLRAHQAGLHREARRAVYLAARLAPRDPRVPYVHGELAALDEAPDEAVAAFERCLRLCPGHRDANFKLGILLDANGDRERAKEHFRAAGRRGRVEALLLLGLLCAEDGERRKARRAFERASALDPDGAVGARAESSLASLRAHRPRRRRSA
jgi:tetratricopeptide (TPR) repeat protein